CSSDLYILHNGIFMFEIFKSKKKPKNLEEVVSQVENLKKDFKKISEELNSLKKEGKFSIQKTGVVRFNPFKDIGGNQSFSIAFLDGNNDGVVISSFYSREGSRVFAKPIEKGQSKYELSEEEKKAIEYARNNRIGS
ncbi:MAG: DUF4446 family protein, partial [Patescibacteria group bacterium]|nr:DUF4446 family protein [Patescibacteria group bacterium]